MKSKMKLKYGDLIKFNVNLILNIKIFEYDDELRSIEILPGDTAIIVARYEDMIDPAYVGLTSSSLVWIDEYLESKCYITKLCGLSDA